MTKKDILSPSEKRQIKLNQLMDQAEQTFETIQNGKDAHPATLFGREINELEKQLETIGQKKN